jgi:hypothetical protein
VGMIRYSKFWGTKNIAHMSEISKDYEIKQNVYLCYSLKFISLFKFFEGTFIMYQKEALHAYKHKNIVAQDKYLNVNPKQ